MEVVWHGDEFVQLETAFPAIVIKDVEEQTHHVFLFKNEFACVLNRGREERTNFLRRVSHMPPALKRNVLRQILSRP